MARLCHARSERWSRSRKSAVCIIATNVSPPDSSRIPLTSLSAPVDFRLGTSVSVGFFDLIRGTRFGSDRSPSHLSASIR